MNSLNIIGCGKMGKTLAHLWAREGTFSINDVLTRSKVSAESAVSFIQAGRAVSSFEEMRPASFFLIGTSENQIESVAEEIVKHNLIRPGTIVFHCSGAFSSEHLKAVNGKGAFVASVHPVKSFAEPETSVATFRGTFCGFEGDKEARQPLRQAFEAIGGTIFEIDSRSKALYHSATVLVCNYLVALLEMGLQTYVQSGLTREQALVIMEPMVRGTLENVFKFDTVQSLTGPIARGDSEVVKNHLKALSEWRPDFQALYAQLGSVALGLSKIQGRADSESLKVISEILKGGERTLVR